MSTAQPHAKRPADDESPPTRTIVFSHANGFPAGCYRVLFDVWQAAGWQVHALPRIGHNPSFPVTSNWPHLRDELLHFIQDEVQPAGPVMLIGHSLGGIVSLLAACKKPSLAAGLVMLDSPVVDGWRAHSLQVVKAAGLIQRVSPGKVSRLRRHEWPSRPDVHAHFASKSKFARWDPRVLQDYVGSGFDTLADGRVKLGFSRDIETRIYDTLPHNLPHILRNHPPRCPVAFIAGTQSEELRQAGAAGSKALAKHLFRWFEGTHLYPFERPDDTAALVLALMREMAPSPTRI
ncbi:Pimeloyl-ACP methyl ester carboxylesterase [Roseateles sp. YR242]|uniref:alpha/beta hydrolase n=1 Tax=Roseateles sp. YR242 TaxID=1855305 RepID=UPI0008D010FF|nr:alpha/beta hydrolase [Roseateles sp. YR242]SEL60568.1 Pimeloyl-ACP methyl ester carboxylesterase [Roseateles sp. YR242]